VLIRLALGQMIMFACPMLVMIIVILMHLT
jgi:hypothetical protein